MISLYDLKYGLDVTQHYETDLSGDKWIEIYEPVTIIEYYEVVIIMVK
jgi:hypothetical protein